VSSSIAAAVSARPGLALAPKLVETAVLAVVEQQLAHERVQAGEERGVGVPTDCLAQRYL